MNQPYEHISFKLVKSRPLERLENAVTDINYRPYTRDLRFIIRRPTDYTAWPTLIIVH
jgi:hypothetical protein